MQAFLLAALAIICVQAQQNPYVSQLNAVKNNYQSLPSECFAGWASIQTEGTAGVASFCQSRLISAFNPNNTENCLASSSLITPAPSASSSAIARRNAESSTASVKLFKSACTMIISICRDAINANGPGQGPTGSNPPYTGDSKTLFALITNSHLDLDLTTIIQSLVEGSVSLKSGGKQNIPGMTLNGGFKNAVIIQVLADGYQVALTANSTGNPNLFNNNGTLGTGIVAFTLDASIASFFLTIALSPNGNFMQVNVMDSRSALGSYIFELKNLRRRARDTNVKLIIGAAPVGRSATNVTSASTNSALSSSFTSTSGNVVSTSSATFVTSSTAASSTVLSTYSSRYSFTASSTVNSATSTTGAATISSRLPYTSTAASTTTGAQVSVGDKTKTTTTITTTTSNNVNIKVGAAKNTDVSFIALLVVLVVLA
ncbi:hypothetical protein HDU79_004278 [Rhizoclosmatium sp. JEL0117]|nr:hypothetical protein HDU79_004278 [Rhizoclosmatium sp. JEL0117]